MVFIAGALVVTALAINRFLPNVPGAILGGVLSILGGIWCLRRLINRLGPDHRLACWALRVPGMRALIG